MSVTLEMRYHTDAKDLKKPWRLFIRNNGPVDTDYTTIAWIPPESAKELFDYQFAIFWSTDDYNRIYNPENKKDTEIAELKRQLKESLAETERLKNSINYVKIAKKPLRGSFSQLTGNL